MSIRMWRNWNSHTLLEEMKNSAAALENSLAFPQKVKHSVTIWSRNSLLGMYAREIKTYLHKDLYTNVSEYHIHNHKEEIIQISIKWQKDK